MNIQVILGGPFGQRLAWTLLHFLWQGFAISAVAAAAAWLLPPTQTRGRYVIALTGLVLMACSVLLTFGVLHVDSPHVTSLTAAPDLSAAGAQPHAPFQMPPSDTAAFAPGLPLPDDAVPSLPPSGPVPAPPAGPSWHARLAQAAAAIQPYAIAAWLAVVLLLSVRLLASVVGVRRLVRGRLPVSAELAACTGRLALRLGLSGPPGVCLSQRVREAMLVGLWRPIVLLPVAWIAEMPPDVLEAVIAHELAHVRRLDLWANLLQRLVETLLFYHPAVWWLSRRASLLREMCADELAVQATGEPMTYAGALEHLGRLRLNLSTPQLAAGIGGRRTALLDRIRNVLGVVPQGERLRWWPAGIMALLAPTALWLVSIAVGQSQPQPAVAVEEIYSMLRMTHGYHCPAFSIFVKNVEGRALQRFTLIIAGRGNSPKMTVVAHDAVLRSDPADRVLKLYAHNGVIDVGGRHSLAFPDVQEFDISLGDAKGLEAFAMSTTGDTTPHEEKPAGTPKSSAALPDAVPKSQEPPAKAAGQSKVTPAAKPADNAAREKNKPYILLPAYTMLDMPDIRRHFGINAAQEKKLREISAEFDAGMRKLSEMHGAAEKLPPQERETAEAKRNAEFDQARNAFRKPIEEVLTAEQRAACKQACRGEMALMLVANNSPKMRQVFGIELSEQQLEQWKRLAVEIGDEQRKKRANAQERALAVLTPQQREGLLARFTHAKVDAPFVIVPSVISNPGATAYFRPENPWLNFQFRSGNDATVAVYSPLTDPNVGKELALTAQQEAKLRAIANESHAVAQKLFDRYEPKPTEGEAPEVRVSRQADYRRTRDEYRRGLEHFGKQVIAQIEAALQPQQVAALKAIARTERASSALLDENGAALDAIHATTEQRAKLRQINDAYESPAPSMPTTNWAGEKALAILTPQQQKKLDETIERRGW